MSSLHPLSLRTSSDTVFEFYWDKYFKDDMDESIWQDFKQKVLEKFSLSIYHAGKILGWIQKIYKYCNELQAKILNNLNRNTSANPNQPSPSEGVEHQILDWNRVTHMFYVLNTILSDCLMYSSSFCSAFNSLDLESIKELGIEQILKSPEFEKYVNDEPYLVIEEIPAAFRVIVLIHKRCTSFQGNNITLFKDLGMSDEYFEKFTKYINDQEQLDSQPLDSHYLNIKESFRANELLNLLIKSLNKEDKPQAEREFKELTQIYQNSYHRRMTVINNRLKSIEQGLEKEKQENEGKPEEEKKEDFQKAHLFSQKHQKVVQVIYKLFSNLESSIETFLQHELGSLPSIAKRLAETYNSLIRSLDLSISLVFIGLIKTGKSTVVNSIVGESLAPNRTEPMTSIPVRYLHDSQATNPVMLVPFSGQLNIVANKLKEVALQNPKIKDEIQKIHLQELLDEISTGNLRFRRRYDDPEMIYQVGVKIHDLFRLAALNCFDLIELLPLDWSVGVENFLTVILKFPGYDSSADFATFSVIDTPGVDESGVEKLKLKKVITSTSKNADFIALTLNALNYSCIENKGLVNEVCERLIESKGENNIILGTQADNIREEQREEIKENIAKFVSEKHTYPKESVYLVSAIHAFLSRKMLTHLHKYQSPPSLRDEREQKFTSDWVFYGVEGLNERKRLEKYPKMTIEQIKGNCEEMWQTSYMEEPWNKMRESGTKSGLSLAINKSLNECREIATVHTEVLQAQKDACIATEERAKVMIKRIEKSHSEMVKVTDELKSKFTSTSENIMADFKSNIDVFYNRFISNKETLEIFNELLTPFETEEQAKEKAMEVKRKCIQLFHREINDLLNSSSQRLKMFPEQIKSELKSKIAIITRNLFEGEPVERKIFSEIYVPKLPETIDDIQFEERVIRHREKGNSFLNFFKKMIFGETPETNAIIDIQELKNQVLNINIRSQIQLVKDGMKKGLEKIVNLTCNEFFVETITRLDELKRMQERQKIKANTARLLSQIIHECQNILEEIETVQKSLNL